jgi:hypothetical protein
MAPCSGILKIEWRQSRRRLAMPVVACVDDGKVVCLDVDGRVKGRTQ